MECDFRVTFLSAVCAENNFNVTFQTLPKYRGHDYDFIINGYPTQVKSINVSSDFQKAAN